MITSAVDAEDTELVVPTQGRGDAVPARCSDVADMVMRSAPVLHG